MNLGLILDHPRSRRPCRACRPGCCRLFRRGGGAGRRGRSLRAPGASLYPRADRLDPQHGGGEGAAVLDRRFAATSRQAAGRLRLPSTLRADAGHLSPHAAARVSHMASTRQPAILPPCRSGAQHDPAGTHSLRPRTLEALRRYRRRAVRAGDRPGQCRERSLLRREARRNAGARRGIRLRQVHAWPLHPAADRAHQRADPVSWPQHQRGESRRNARACAARYS